VITSLLIAVAMSYGWWWSKDSALMVTKVGDLGEELASVWDLGVTDGRVVASCYSVPPSHYCRFGARLFDAAAHELDRACDTYGWRMAGFGFIRDFRPNGVALMAPAWFIILLALLLPGHWLMMARRTAKRARIGCCAKCGYDLRGHREHGHAACSTQCPECGWVDDG
jgi:hypothetical protein